MDGTRVVLRVTARPDAGCPEVDAYKRLENNELVSINATLQVEAQMSGRPTASRQSSVSSVSRPESCQPPAPAPAAGVAAARGTPSPTEQLQRLRLSEAAPTAAPSAQQPPLEAIQQYRVPRDGDGYLDVTVSCCSSPWNIYVSVWSPSYSSSSMAGVCQPRGRDAHRTV